MYVSRGRRLIAISVVALAAGGAVVPASPAFAASWSIVATPNPLSGNRFDGVDALSASDAWAVGWGDTGTTPGIRPVVARWNGTAWSSVGTAWSQESTPSAGSYSTLMDASAAGTGTVWGIGSQIDGNWRTLAVGTTTG